MTKKTINISIDVAVYEKHRARGTNISDICNTFLANYGMNVKRLRERAVLKAADLVEAVEGEKIKADRDKELRHMLQEAARYRASHLDRANTILRNICEKFGIEWTEAVRRMERV